MINATALEADGRILHLLYHRNRNQHRLAKWWKWLSLLRRSVANLLLAFRSHDDQRVSFGAQHLRETLLPKCYS